MKVVRWGVALCCLLAFALAVAFLGYRQSSQPDYAGQLRLPGLSAPVTIVRDAHAVPHIRAGSADDALTGLGYAQAQDRLWQFEMNRRIVAGQLSEILGAATLDTDKFLRTLGVRRVAARQWEEQDAMTQSAIKAYVAGINARIEEVRGKPWRLPPEFLLLGIEPQPWTPEDVIGWGTMMGWELGGNMNQELLRAALWSRLGAARLQALLPTDPVTPLPDFASVYGERLAISLAPPGIQRRNPASPAPPPGQVFEALYLHLARLFPSTGQEGIGSNNWVVAPARSSTGAALLANDPHLAMATPALWHLAHLSWPGHDVAGGGIVGLPAIVSGRTAEFAWGLTNYGSDTQDLVLEELLPNEPGWVRRPRKSFQLALRQEEIKVRDGAPVSILVRSSDNGPIVSDVLPLATQSLVAMGARAGEADRRFVLALRWAQLRSPDRSIKAALMLNRASDFEAFEAALQMQEGAQQVFVYADRRGRIALLAPGLVPLRGEQDILKGLAPVPGWDERFQWRGTIANQPGASPFPRLVDPSQGWLASANQKPMGLSDSTFTGAEFTRPYRFDRIVQLLQAQPKHDLASFAQIQGDQRSLIMARIVRGLLRLDPDPALHGAAPDALNRLKAWSDEGLRATPAGPGGALMAAERAEPLIATMWLDAFRKRLLSDEIGEPLYKAFEAQRLKTDLVLDVLEGRAGAEWCDRIDTPARETCAELAAASLKEALATLVTSQGADPARWQWGKAHPVLFEHRPIGKHPLLGRWFNLSQPLGGDATTVFAARHHPWETSDPLTVRWGPGLRARHDLSDPEKSEYIIAPGQSGHRFSPYYSHLMKAWGELRGIPISFNPATVKAQAIGEFTLSP